jgi:antitoxin VapB
MHQTAKLCTTAKGQFVLLPLEFHFNVSEVFIHQDSFSGDVVLSLKPTDWQGLLDAVSSNKQDDFVIERRQNNVLQQPKRKGRFKRQSWPTSS